MISLTTMKVFLICCIIELLCFSPMASNSDINLADFKTNSDSLQARMQSYFQDINAFNAMYPQEKVYLHFDNTAYFLEETIWFKAYVMAANAQRQSQLSKVLYVELLSPEGAVLETKKYPIVNGGCHGEFHLDSLYLSGYYEVRAYTRYMLNFGDDAVFSRVFPVYKNVPEGNYHQKTILDRDLSRRKKIRSYHDDGQYSLWSYIFPPTKALRKKYHYEPLPKWEPKKRRSTVSASTAFDDQIYEKEAPIKMEFFPEGGVIVDSVEQRVAFQISDKEGRGLNFSGGVYNERGKLVAQIKPAMDGCGVFTFKASAQESYEAIIKHEDREFRFPLPEIYPSGCALAVNNQYGSSQIVITAHYRKDELFNDSLIAVALSQGGNIYRFHVVEAADEYQLSIDKDSMPEGVNTISVFDREGRALAERMCFIKHDKAHRNSLSIQDNSHGYAFNPYGKILLQATAEDHEGKPVQGHISLAVRDAESDDISYNSDNFYTWLLLSSELKGYIKHASYYFEKDDRNRHHHLDLLMLTRGWSRYQWENMNEQYMQAGWKQPIEKGIMADGSVINLERLRKPRLKDAKLSFTFSINDEPYEYFGRVSTNEIGNYALLFPHFYGQGNLWISMRDFMVGPHHMVSMNRWYSPKPKFISYYELNVPSGEYASSSETNIYSMDDGLRQIDLDEVGIERKSLRRRIRYQYSMQHYNIAEELEYMCDTYKIPLSAYYERPDTLVMSIMDRYNFPPCDFNTVLASSYPSDSELPEGKLYWKVYQYAKKIPYQKEIVIRSEPEVLEKFWISLYEAVKYYDLVESGVAYTDSLPRQMEVPDIGEISAVFKADFGKNMSQIKPTRFKLPPYNNRDMRPDCVAFFLPADSAEMIEPPLVMGQRKTKIQGYSYSKDFVHPDYTGVPVQDLPRDYRRTLYWNPNVTLDENGRAEIEFFNNSTCRHLSISAEGLSHDGKPLVFKK